jgi:hypothetical protein
MLRPPPSLWPWIEGGRVNPSILLSRIEGFKTVQLRRPFDH